MNRDTVTFILVMLLAAVVLFVTTPADAHQGHGAQAGHGHVRVTKVPRK